PRVPALEAFVRKRPKPFTVADNQKVDRSTNREYVSVVTSGPSQIKLWLFRLIAAAWLMTAIPIILLSVFLMELPLWPTFGSDSTTEGIILWAVFAAWFYITPVLLLVASRKWNGRSLSQGRT
ncbi:hypothetical protein, partial [Novosphingobium sp. CCH12-A3]|uniref:hypothetical protein n=1 Tax=Novosphingobium sp. CCH12-A3 TaxID=1768752 RepID=UPI000AC92028